MEKMQEACGVFGVFDQDLNVTAQSFAALCALQHRGQESAGLAATDGFVLELARGSGLVSEVFSRAQIPSKRYWAAIGHVRYSTSGVRHKRPEAQPLLADDCSLALAHNGNLPQAAAWQEKLQADGYKFRTTMDSEILLALILTAKAAQWPEKIIEGLSKVKGAYALTLLTKTALFGVRDVFGFRPLCLGRKGAAWALASESCALTASGFTLVRDVLPGELIMINRSGIHSYQLPHRELMALCAFEYIYFARPDTVMENINIYEARFALGKALARQTSFCCDKVIGVPFSGMAAALGFAAGKDVPLTEGFVRNRYIGRTFLRPLQLQRELSVKMKFSPIVSQVKGASIALIDDSIVRGTTMRQLVELLRQAGANAVHVCISSPPLKHTCCYGIDISHSSELLAAESSVEEIRSYIGADSLHFLSLANLQASLPQIADRLCYACFTGKYPLPPSMKGE